MEEYMPFVWIGIAVVMAVGEAATNQLVSIWFVVGALRCRILSYYFVCACSGYSVYRSYLRYAHCYKTACG